MSEFLYFSCLEVRIWRFSSVLTTFRKIEKIEDFPPPRPCQHFYLNSHMCTDFIQMSKFLYFSCPEVSIWWFSSVLKTFRKIEKIEDFPQPGHVDIFVSIHTCAQISSKWVNFYILVVLKWEYDDFLQFWKLLGKSKKLKIFPQHGPVDIFYLNSHMCLVFIEMREFLYFSCPEVRIWWFSSVLKTFRKIEKNWRFFPPRPCRHFCLNSHMCTDFIQMSEFLYFSCPEVRIWWFSSVLKTFRKIEILKIFPHPGLVDIFVSIHTCAQISSKWVNFYILVVLKWEYDDFLQFWKLLKKSKKLKIFPTPALSTFLSQFTHVHRFHPNEWIFIF